MTSKKKTQKDTFEADEQTFHRMFEEHSAVMLLVEHKSGRILDANNAASQFYGYSVKQLKSMSTAEINIMDPGQDAIERSRVFHGEKKYFNFQHKLASGEIREVEIYASPIDSGGETVLFAIIQDITEHKQAETALEQEKESLAKLLSVSEEFLANSEVEIDYQKITDNILEISGGKFAVFNLFDENGKDFQTMAISGLSEQFQKITSVLGFELSGKKWPHDETRAAKTQENIITRFASLFDLAGDALPKPIMVMVKKLFNPGEALVAKIFANEQALGDFTIIMSAGESFAADNLVSIYIRQVGLLLQRKKAEVALQKNAAELERINHQLEVALSHANEMAAQAVHSEELIRESEARYRAVFDSAKDAIVSSNYTGTIISWNHGAEVTFGYPETEAVGLPLTMLMPPLFSNAHLAGMERMQAGGEKHIIGKTVEVEGQRKDGNIFPLEISLAEWRVGNDQFYTAIMRDISERRQVESELRRAQDELQQSYAREQQLSRTDGLTGIDNRRSLLILAKREFDVAMRYQPPLSMIFFDIDNFKQINDTFGHAVGDQALIKIIQTVCAKIRSTDLIGRYGGDEFIILMPQTSAQDALLLTNRIHASVADMRLDTDKGPLTVTVSIGISQTIHDPTQTDTVENLLMRADQALYSAKQAGRNCSMIFG